MNAVSHVPRLGEKTKPLSAASANLSPSIPKTLRYVEWTFVLLVVLRVGLLMLNKPLGYEMGPGDYLGFTVLGVLVILSIVFPLQQPMGLRRGYILLEIVVLLISRLFTNWGFDPFLYLVLVKSCFLLSRRDVIFTTILAGIAWQLSLAQRIFHEFSIPTEELRAQFEESLAAPKALLVLDVIINSTTIYVITCLLTILLCWAVLSERKSRQQAAALSQEVETLATDLERTRIARDIHDSLGHTLTTLNVQLEVAQTLYSQQPDQSLQALNRAKILSSQSLQEVRRAVSTIRHGTFNLPDALTGLVEQIQQAHATEPLKIETRISLPTLPLQVNQQLFLIIKEGLTNIQKHAQASTVKLWAQQTTEGIAMGLADDGVGFVPEASNSGYGLRGMQERVQLLGGQMTIQSTLGKGTLIQVTVPQ
ncbi:sensor histidine kinase [Leptolyngbyaceae cyanobacterium CCMR0082]|uniref:Oxygen sensor histidine kinase NreB n=2 Tax=Adonisia turfae TaxID=2950184 RepID=A0A6M0S0W3_9CYAN|nr:sensor histidine kinase [Adonisia turfae]MDV3349071.1 sensor histidine kinase [Leptothoe sp. LEGE 181152]NEZ59426.1 sensor histidine kinase [Adonisia turfae CCMR0081]NEZ62095.1 sensor histidine kinase [Adonisia turfae CCMR0082]